MDEFDIIDLVYTHVANANPGMTIYKDRSMTGEDENHIVVSGLQYHELEWRNTMPVNVNIFIKLSSKSDMPNRTLMREVKKDIRTELLKIKPKNGEFKDIKIEGARRLTGAKDGFDCTNIRIIINTQKNISEYGN